MELLGPKLDCLGDRLRGVPHAFRESWPLNRFPRSRDWELLVIIYLIVVTILLAIFLTVTHNTPHGL